MNVYVLTNLVTPFRHPFPVVQAVRAVAMTASLMTAMGAVVAEDADDDDEDFNTRISTEFDPTYINDFRFSYAMLPANADISMLDKNDSGNAGNYQRESVWDKAGRTGVMWMTPWSAASENGDFIVGLEISTNHYVIEQAASSPEIDYRTVQLTIHPGLAWLIEDNFHIEINPFFGVGQAQFDQNIAGDGSDIYFELGLRFGAYYTWRNGFQLGMQTGYLYGYTEGETVGNDATFDTEIVTQGLFLGFQIGYRL
jgi:hypothetical protein